MSAIFYRFKSQRQDSRLAIDGTGISVFDLKKEIIIANQMGDGKEFDLGLYDSNGEGAFLFACYCEKREEGLISAQSCLLLFDQSTRTTHSSSPVRPRSSSAVSLRPGRAKGQLPCTLPARARARSGRAPFWGPCRRRKVGLG